MENEQQIAAQALVAFLGSAAAGQFLTKSYLENAVAPIVSTLAQMNTQLAAMNTQLVAMNTQLTAVQEFTAVQAQMQVQLAPHNAPVIAAAASATVLSITASRKRKAHDYRRDELHAVVTRRRKAATKLAQRL